MDAAHHAHDGLLDAAGSEALLRDDVGDHLGIDRRLKHCAALCKLFPHSFGVCEVAVVRDGEAAFCISHQKRLAVLHKAPARRGIADMADGDLPWKGG